MVVSKKTLSLICCVAIKGEARGQGAPQSSQAFYCAFSPAVTTYFKLPFSSNSNLDLISVLELQGFDNGCGKPWSSRTEIRSRLDRKSTRLNSSHTSISYPLFSFKKKKQ